MALCDKYVARGRKIQVCEKPKVAYWDSELNLQKSYPQNSKGLITRLALSSTIALQFAIPRGLISMQDMVENSVYGSLNCMASSPLDMS